MSNRRRLTLSHPDPSSIEFIRKRPAMYVGSTEFFGLIRYFVSAVNLHLAGAPSYVAVSMDKGAVTIESDAELVVTRCEDGVVLPFERLNANGMSPGIDGPILMALSKSLLVHVASPQGGCSLECRSGKRVGFDVRSGAGRDKRLTMTFVPDPSIFTIESISPYNFHSYLKRLSYLFPGIRLSVSANGQREEFRSANGLVDMFEGVVSPYQLVHEPVHFHVREAELDLEVIFAFQSWSGNRLWSFVNRGRAVLGGTHERGLAAGLQAFRSTLNRSVRKHRIRNGLIAMMSLLYPRVRWEGCLRARIGDPELGRKVKRLVFEGSCQWLRDRPNVEQDIAAIGTFQFPDVWYR